MIILNKVGAIVLEASEEFKKLGLNPLEKEQYIANAILKECGWEEYIKRCKKIGILPSKCPCEGLGGQCNMFCHMYLKGCCK